MLSSRGWNWNCSEEKHCENDSTFLKFVGALIVKGLEDFLLKERPLNRFEALDALRAFDIRSLPSTVCSDEDAALARGGLMLAAERSLRETSAMVGIGCG